MEVCLGHINLHSAFHMLTMGMSWAGKGWIEEVRSTSVAKRHKRQAKSSGPLRQIVRASKTFGISDFYQRLNI